MSPALSPDLFLLPFEEPAGEDELPGGAAASDPADYIYGWGDDDFYVHSRSSASGSAQPFEHEGLRIGESDSDTVTDEQIVAIGDADLPFFWECLHVEDEGSGSMEEFDWEDVAGREVFSLMPFAGDDSAENANPNSEEGDETGMTVDWEFLLTVNDNESVLVEDQEGFSYAASEYEDLFGQFGDHGGAEWMKGGRPAARSVVENLPSVQLTEDDICCAVCKEEISVSDEVKGLPCLHYYHEHCIVAWLVVRNTCPLCRYELPSSDSIDAAAIEGEEEGQAGYEFEILQAS